MEQLLSGVFEALIDAGPHELAVGAFGLRK